jgi:hypothetical protein
MSVVIGGGVEQQGSLGGCTEVARDMEAHSQHCCTLVLLTLTL